MGIHVECEKCGYKYHLKDELAGKRVKCKICQTSFTVPSPSEVIVHGPRTKDFEPAFGDSENIDRISGHMERYIGKADIVFHEILSDLVHVDVHWIQPTGERPHHTFVTSGMSDRPMTVPPQAENFRYAELMLSLPPEWPVSEEAFKDERNYWPIRLLKVLARFPHEYETGLCFGHTVPNGDPAEPYAANTKLCCALLLFPLRVEQEFWSLKVDDEKTIWFYSVVPIYREEMDFKVKSGVDPLIDKFDEQGVSELLDVSRANVCKKKGWW